MEVATFSMEFFAFWQLFQGSLHFSKEHKWLKIKRARGSLSS